MKKVFSVVLITLSFYGIGFAQSPMGLNLPLGMPSHTVTGPSASMAGSGSAVIDEYFGTSLNPGNIAIGNRAAFSGLVSYERTGIKDNSESSSASGYSPRLLSLILPLGTVGNIGFSTQRQYDANLNFYSKTDPVFPSDGDEFNYIKNIELKNTGGLTAWQAGWGYRLKNQLSFGLMYERLFFNSESRTVFESTLNYHDGITFQNSMNETVVTSFTGDGFGFGMQIPVHKKATAGVSAKYVLYSDKNGSSTREYQRSDTSAPQEKSREKFSIHLPPSINAGLSYTPNSKWLFAVDGRCTMWEHYYHELENTKHLRNTYGVSAGTRFVPATSRFSSKYWEKIHYRAGFSYNQLAIDKSQEYLMTLGTGLPIPNDGGLIDIIFGYGHRSADRYSDYSENVIKFELGINGGRSWFQKTASTNY
ncbi:MAG: hypothetical protein LBI42_05795 [Chitinispirillales bacterium]|jgi:hypothetical protein|nr:hypothetical protein [Chitinispirillales bacterium]